MAVIEGPVPQTPFGPEGGGLLRCSDMALKMPSNKWSIQQKEQEAEVEVRRDEKFDIWSSIQASKKDATAELPPPYVHPLMRRSSSSLSQKSLEICTESLGSETGSDGFSDINDYLSSLSSKDSDEEEIEESETHEEIEDKLDEEDGFYGRYGRKELAAVNYHCSIGRRPPIRSFPPPLPSISRRDGPCVHMRPHRRDGRLVVEAVPVPSQNYLHCHRQGGRLLLTFIETAFEEIYPEAQNTNVDQEEESQQQVEEEEEMEEDVAGVDDRGLEESDIIEEEEEVEEEIEEEESEEVEVLDRGIMVEVKVSRQPQLQNGGMKVHRSSLVINKFVSGTPLGNQKDDKADTEKEEIAKEAGHAPRWLVPADSAASTTRTTTNMAAPAAAVVESIQEVDGWGSGQVGGGGGGDHHHQAQDNKLLFTSKKLMNRQALLHQVRRCSYQHRPLFIWEPCCIATS